MNDTANGSTPPRKRRRRRPTGGDQPDTDIDRLAAGGRELWSHGWPYGVIVGGSLAGATWAGHFEQIRSSLVLLATATVVIMVLASDALRTGAKSGFKTPARQRFAGTAGWLLIAGTAGVVLAAAGLPWVGQFGQLWCLRLIEAFLVGVVGFVLGGMLSALLVVTVDDVRSRHREDDEPSDTEQNHDSPAGEQDHDSPATDQHHEPPADELGDARR